MLSTLTLAAVTAASPAPSAADRANIALAGAIVQRVGDRLWPNWSTTPFAIDLVTPQGGVMLNVAQPFTPPSFPPGLEATLFLGNGQPTVVIGEPAATGIADPTRWTVTLLHEHFHQWQDSWPQYQAAVAALGLKSPGDTNGNWMLDFPFPYGDARVDAGYDAMAKALVDAIAGLDSADFSQRFARYRAARTAFIATVDAKSQRYFSFQCWQEGVARYTELAVARLAANAHAADRAFLNDAQAAALANDADGTLARILKRLRTISLKEGQRSNFYAVGAGEALLLDRASPGWHDRYLQSAMDLSAHFPN